MRNHNTGKVRILDATSFNIFRDAGIERVSPGACNELSKYLYKKGLYIAKQSQKITKASRRKNVRADDIKIIISLMEEK